MGACKYIGACELEERLSGEALHHLRTTYCHLNSENCPIYVLKKLESKIKKSGLHLNTRCEDIHRKIEELEEHAIAIDRLRRLLSLGSSDETSYMVYS